MGSRCFYGGFRFPCFNDDDGLAKCNLPCCREERPCVADGLHVNHDAARSLIVAQIVDEIPPTDVDHGADRDEAAESHHLPQTPIEHRIAESAALTDKGYIPGPRHSYGKCCIQPCQRAH